MSPELAVRPLALAVGMSGNRTVRGHSVPHLYRPDSVLAPEDQRLQETSSQQSSQQATDGVSEHPGVGCKNMYMYFFLEAVSFAFQILNSQRAQSCHFLRQKPKHANTYLVPVQGNPQ